MVAATKAIKVVNADNSSKAESTIQVKNYIKNIFNAPPTPIVTYPPAIITGGSSGGGGGKGAFREFNTNLH